MATYVVNDPETGETMTVEARGPAGAALIAAKAWFKEHVTECRRTTGNPGMSGRFQPYHQMRDGALNSVGHPIHVSELDD